jgi:hypothetical protein
MGLILSKIGPGMGIFSLNKSMNNFTAMLATFVQIISIGAAVKRNLNM